MSRESPVKPLEGRRIAVPESRELNLFAGMLEERGAIVSRCPLVSIHDSPRRQAIETWLREFSRGNVDDLILLTGEGLRRLLGFADRAGEGLRGSFVQALADVRKITRGPKPANALRRIGLKTDLPSVEPTTDGVIRTLEGMDLQDRGIAVQLYGDDPNEKLVDFLSDRGARVSTVSPYIYADDSEDSLVEDLIRAIIAGGLDAIAFTSSPQVRRLFQVARRCQLEEPLRQGLDDILVAAVGPVVADSLRQKGVTVDLMPESTYFMKPLVRQLMEAFQR